MENFGNPKDCMDNLVLIEYSFQMERGVHLESKRLVLLSQKLELDQPVLRPYYKRLVF